MDDLDDLARATVGDVRERVPMLFPYDAVLAGVRDLVTRDDKHPLNEVLFDHLLEMVSTHVGASLVEHVLSDASDEHLFIMTEGCAIEMSDILDDSGSEEHLVIVDKQIPLGGDMHLKFPIAYGLVDRE